MHNIQYSGCTVFIWKHLERTDLVFLCSDPVSIRQVYKKAVGQMSQGLIRRLTVLSQYEEALVRINATATERLTALKAKPQAAIQRDLLSICNDPFTVAQQLTHIELVRITHLFTETNQSNSFILRIQVFQEFFAFKLLPVDFLLLDTLVY